METKLKWYQKKVTTVIFLIVFFPVGLYLMWKNQHWTKPVRIILTVFLVVFGIMNADFSDRGNGYHCGYCLKEITGTPVYNLNANVGESPEYCSKNHMEQDWGRLQSELTSKKLKEWRDN